MTDSYKPPYTITSKMVKFISSISEELTKVEYNKQNGITPKLRKKNRIKTLAGTLEIEGNFLGEEKITAIVEGKRVLGSMLEVAEVEGAIKAYGELENYRYNKIDDLLKAHKFMMGGVLKDAGKFRSSNVGVGGKDGLIHVAPQTTMVPNLMNNLFKWLNSTDEHPLIVSSVFHYEFEFIHPFSDGNGRIGRLWQSVILYNYKDVFSTIPTESIIRENQDRYYEAIEKSTSMGESTPFVEFMLEVIKDSLKNYTKQSKKNVPRKVPKDVPLKRLDEIIQIIKKNNQVTIIQIAGMLGVSDKTIKRDIVKLKDQNRLTRVGSLRSGCWKVLDDTKHI